MIRDRDRIYGAVVTRRLRAIGIRDKPTAHEMDILGPGIIVWEQYGVNFDRWSRLKPIRWRDALRLGSIASIWRMLVARIAPVFFAREDWSYVPGNP